MMDNDMIANRDHFGERKMSGDSSVLRIKKRRPGERGPWRRNKGAGILRMETVVPRQLLKYFSKCCANNMASHENLLTACLFDIFLE